MRVEANRAEWDEAAPRRELTGAGVLRPVSALNPDCPEQALAVITAPTAGIATDHVFLVNNLNKEKHQDGSESEARA